MKSLQTLCLAVLTMASFHASAELNAAQLLGTLLKAIPQQQKAQEQSTPASASNTPAQGGTVATTTPAATTSSKLDWTPLLKDWENGCAGNSTLDAFTMGLDDGKIVLPSPYREGVGKMTRSTKAGDVTIRLAIAGTYYGMPVKAFERYHGTESGVNGYALVLAVNKTVAQKGLSKVIYRADPEADFKAIVTSSGKDAAVVCDRSM